MSSRHTFSSLGRQLQYLQASIPSIILDTRSTYSYAKKKHGLFLALDLVVTPAISREIGTN